MSPELHFLDLENIPIWRQLQIEEALLRSDNRNWCLINRGSPPAIVMGISGKPEELLNTSLIQKYQIPVWKRFSGGGTVIVDQNTLFVTFIFNSAEVNIPGFPEMIHSGIQMFYGSLFSDCNVVLRENDYVIGDRKCGGNAQYIRKDRWLHHTSFLWSYESKLMDCLLVPPKMPGYRNKRGHEEFLCTLHEHFSEKESFFKKIFTELQSRFHVRTAHPDLAYSVEKREHRKATVCLVTNNQSLTLHHAIYPPSFG